MFTLLTFARFPYKHYKKQPCVHNYVLCVHKIQTMIKDKQLKVRVTSDQLYIIRVNAKKSGLSVSQYVIDKCVHNTETCTQIKPIERVHKDKCVHKTKESIKPVRKLQDKDNIIPAWKVRLLEQQAAIKAKKAK